MIVVSNTTPLNHLVLIGKEHILPSLFGTVVVPPAVVEELSRKDTPERVIAWIRARPSWLAIRAPAHVDPAIDLDRGESEAIALAEELHADRVLIDESKARKEAVRRGLKPAGTLAVLFEPHERGLLDLRLTIAELRETSFYLDERLIRTILGRLGAE